MESKPEVTYIFRATGENAVVSMERLIAYAHTLGNMSISEVGFEPLEVGPERAAEHLYTLLSQPGPYRDKWLLYSERNRGKVNQSAITQVLADWLNETRHENEEPAPNARQLKDKVSRALAGSFTPGTMEWFIGAFDMTEGDAEQLRQYYTVANTD